MVRQTGIQASLTKRLMSIIQLKYITIVYFSWLSMLFAEPYNSVEIISILMSRNRKPYSRVELWCIKAIKIVTALPNCFPRFPEVCQYCIFLVVLESECIYFLFKKRKQLPQISPSASVDYLSPLLPMPNMSPKASYNAKAKSETATSIMCS